MSTTETTAPAERAKQIRERLNEIAPYPATEEAAPAPCDCGPGERCFDCATDGDLIAAIPDWPGSEAGRMAAEPRKDT